MNVQATDADIVDPFNRVTYSLIGDGLATSLFTVTPDTGAIRTQNTLNSDNSEQYVLRVVAMDGGTPRLTDTSTVLVTVNRNLNAPQLQPQNYSIGILATQALSIPILTINAADADVAVPYNTVVFRPTSSPLFSEFFGVDPSSGDVNVKKDLALRSDISTYIGTVSVCDSASSPRCSDVPSYVTVLVTHNQNTPFFINEPYRRDLQRTLGAGTGVLTVQAEDRDDPSTIFGQIRYTLIGDDQAPNFFSINPTSGLIEISNALGQTSDNLYQLRVQACDLGGMCNRTTVIVTITTNFQAPIITPATYTQTVQETISLGTPIIDVNATDADPTAPNNQITYVISEGPEDLECFTINQDTGVITARRSLLYNPCTASVYSMLVVARDRGSPLLESTAASVTINVQRNDNPPIFTNEPYITSLREDASINDPVFTVTAVDTDIVAPFNTIQFSLIGDDTAPVYFDIRQIDNNNAQIFVKAPVLNDDKTTYIVRVRAADGGIPSKSDTTTVRITVNRNLFAPRFDPLITTSPFFETQSLGLSIFQVTATDGDSKAPYNTVQYEVNNILSSVPGRLYFMVDRNTGGVSLRCFLESDTSYTGVYTIVVDAVDGGGLRANPPANVEITMDRNTTLRPPNDTNSMLPRASLCCQEPLLPYWGGSNLCSS
ncbi:protocadherin Fat 4-like isoform X2 [Haliotis rubra]|uniref:protocadherin Fat 4-like isoform X2 n=1 Tax=Haliotis rubra TaxID=36100 RepID=UPI001EE51BA3|nr:protocadherin Fat 4-like isoform X2 [Haliotis rubra]